jgi:tRNA pseudouridine38-40 synthase
VLGRGRLVVYRVEADGFLHHMVRNIAGTLIEIGLGKRPEDSLVSILEGRDRTRAGPTAEAHGLYLVRVWY